MSEASHRTPPADDMEAADDQWRQLKNHVLPGNQCSVKLVGVDHFNACEQCRRYLLIRDMLLAIFREPKKEQAAGS